MKEIKFRAWDEFGKKIVSWQQLQRLPHWWTGAPRMILMQYTGLKDKNGKEIYEGDILEVPMPGLTYDIMSVEWKRIGRDEGWMLCEKGEALYPVSWAIGNERTPGLLNDWDDRTKIIGNIYENPKILKGGDKL